MPLYLRCHFVPCATPSEVKMMYVRAPIACVPMLGNHHVPQHAWHAIRTPQKRVIANFAGQKKPEDWANYALAMSFRHRQAPCAASSPQHQQTPCATAFSVSLDCVCCFIFIKFAPLFYICPSKSNFTRPYKTLRNQNWHAAIYIYIYVYIIYE